MGAYHGRSFHWVGFEGNYLERTYLVLQSEITTKEELLWNTLTCVMKRMAASTSLSEGEPSKKRKNEQASGKVLTKQKRQRGLQNFVFTKPVSKPKSSAGSFLLGQVEEIQKRKVKVSFGGNKEGMHLIPYCLYNGVKTLAFQAKPSG